jgi:aquaporin Z
VSGAHFNPAVTLGVFLRGKCPAGDVAPYMLAQVIGAVLAAAVVQFLLPGASPTPLVAPVGQALVAEFLYTFALVYVILNVATAKKTDGNSFYGLAIGMTVMVGAFSVGSISGGAFNPAVAVGASILGLLAWSNIWIYLVANFAAGVAASLVFRITSPGDAVTSPKSLEP